MALQHTDILRFWFEESSPAQWFKKDLSFDAQVRTRFGDFTTAQIALFRKNSTHPWQAQADSALALILLADQFPRNIYRDKPEAFAWGAVGVALAEQMVAQGQDKELTEGQRAFAYLPFMHSESLEHQARCIALIKTQTNNEASLHHAQEHYEVIKKFARFPHRNAILGRTSTAEEKAFLVEGGYQP